MAPGSGRVTRVLGAAIAAKLGYDAANHVYESVRITEDPEKKRDKCPCIVGTYAEIKDLCKAAKCNGEAHHIVPDYTLRYGTREEGKLVNPERNKRIKGMPSFNGGAAICLEGRARDDGSEHWEAHGADIDIAELGQPLFWGDRSPAGTPIGTAPIGSIKEAATNQVLKLKADDPACQALIKTEVARSFSGTNDNSLGRTTTMPPRPGSDAYKALSGQNTDIPN